MTGPDAVFTELLVQPDRRSCGASVLVVARMLLDRGYAELLATGRHPATGLALPGAPGAPGSTGTPGTPGTLADRFRREVLGMHRRVTGPVDVRGRLQLPWPRALGTPPWAAARQLSATGRPRVGHAVVVAAARGARGAVFDRIVAAVGRGRPVPVYVGNRWAPRHVVLFLGSAGTAGAAGTAGTADRLRCYDPARGLVVEVEREAFVRGRLGLAGWDRPWFAVLPLLRRRGRAGRRPGVAGGRRRRATGPRTPA